MKLVKALLVGVVELVAFGWLAGLVCSVYLDLASVSSLRSVDPESAILAPLWGWLLVAVGLVTAAAILAGVILTRRASREPGWVVRTTVVVLPVAFSAQLVYTGAQWSSLTGGVMAVGCAVCVAVGVAAFILTRRQGLPRAQAPQPSQQAHQAGSQ